MQCTLSKLTLPARTWCSERAQQQRGKPYHGDYFPAARVCKASSRDVLHSAHTSSDRLEFTPCSSTTDLRISGAPFYRRHHVFSVSCCCSYTSFPAHTHTHY